MKWEKEYMEVRLKMILTKSQRYSILEVVHIDNPKLNNNEIRIIQIMSLGEEYVAIEYEFK